MKPILFLSPRGVMLVLTVAMVLVVFLSLPVQYFRYGRGDEYVYGIMPIVEPLFDLNGEANLPAWFSSTLLMIAALLLAGIGLAERVLQRAYSRHWIGLAGVFAFLSLDEAAELHERAGKLLGLFVQTGGVLFFTWVLLGAAFVLVMGIVYFGFLRALPTRTRNFFVLSGIVFVGGALGMELVAGYYADTDPTYFDSFRRFALTHTEELLEKTGVLLFIYALLDYWRAHVGPVVLSAERPGLSRVERAEAVPEERDVRG